MSTYSEELLYIYATLRKLGCIQVKGQTSGSNQKTVPLETLVFPRRFVLKQLNERLEGLDNLANEICNDLFRQVSGQPKGVEPKDKSSHPAIDVQNETNRYPEFDEYFHFCLHQLHDFMIGLHWHEADIVQLSKSDSDYVSKNLQFVGYLMAFQRSLLDLVGQAEIRSPRSTRASPQTPQADGKKSNLKSSPGKRDSPQARRRVRFKDLPPINKNGDRKGQNAHQTNDLADNHSVLALDLLIYAINIYIQRLADTLVVWSAGIQDELNKVIDQVFDSRAKVRSQQLQVIAKKIKIYNDVHLTVLDHLSEIKRTYLIRHVRGTLLSKDPAKVLFTYKTPRLRVYIQRIGSDVEVKILARLVKQCLQIFFNLIVCEINFDSVEVSSKKNEKEKKNKSQENIMSFMSNWFKVDDVLFGTNVTRKPSVKEHPSTDPLLKPIDRPQLVAKTSTLSLNDKYASSSRILAQMDNLGEFMREFLHMIVQRLRYEQQLRYFLEAIVAGLAQFFDIVGPKLEKQIIEIKSKERPAGNETKQKPELAAKTARKQAPRTLSSASSQRPATEVDSIELILARMRCLKFIHVMGQADRIVFNEAARMKVELGGDMDLDLKLAKLTQICMNTSKWLER